MSELTQEQQILITMRKTLAAIIKDVTPPSGMKHPLSEQTVTDVCRCPGLISAREKELAETQGRTGERPYYADEPQVRAGGANCRVGQEQEAELRSCLVKTGAGVVLRYAALDAVPVRARSGVI